MVHRQLLRWTTAALVAVVSAAAAPVYAAKRIAVLEFRGDAHVKPDVLALMADAARGGVLSALTSTANAGRYDVMTRESMAVMLKDMGKDLQCKEGECEVETARNIGANLVVTGDVVLLEGSYIVTLKLHETVRGALLATQQSDGKGQLEVVRKLPDAVSAMVQSGLGLAGTNTSNDGAPQVTSNEPAIKKGTVTEVVGNLTIAARPQEKAQLEITDPGGKTSVTASPFTNSSAAVGKWRVVARATGYSDSTQEFLVAPDAVTAINLELKLRGGLKVSGTPEGAAVKVTGPGGFSNSGGLPWEASGLASGEYRVEVTRTGYARFERAISVPPGAIAAVVAELHKETTPSASAGVCIAGMARIPGGSFVMEDSKEQVNVQAFCLDLTEVTVEAYAACSRAKKCPIAPTMVEWPGIKDEERKKLSQSCNGNRVDRQKHPVNCVDWHQAAAYCAAQEKRLPTEEEWEWAARGGDEARKYPWGNADPGPTRLNACGAECKALFKQKLGWDWKEMYDGDDGWPETAPVGGYPAGDNRWGVHDLAGNVWEWTASLTDTKNSDRISRGGGWEANDPALVRASVRATTRFRDAQSLEQTSVALSPS